MNLWNMIIKEIKSHLRAKESFIFLLAFPIVLMLILGSALSNAFSTNTRVGNLDLLYNNMASSPQIATAWSAFATDMEQSGLSVTSKSNELDGKQEVSNDHYAAYVELSDSGIKFYGSTKRTIESDIIQGMLIAFTDKYNLAVATYQSNSVDSQAIMGQATAQTNYVHETSLNPDRLPNSFDYYAIVMTTMFALYAAMPGSQLFNSEKKYHTLNRLIASPLSKKDLFAGKVIGSTFINFIFMITVFLFSKYVFNAYWGNHIEIVLLLLFTQVLMAVSLGLTISFFIKGDASSSVVMIFTQIASFIGGAYFPVESTTGIFSVITYLSPLRWANTSMLELIYFDNAEPAFTTMGINVGIAAVLLFIASLVVRKREVL
ncbi:MAG: ABC transporter permease [Candidatus Cohnella colombiensis]|uniref:ABC transporter permease n=1 Tax=Candidatus Cohnella colombiensis TaxID=3121368 RepID=A0AA95EX50_9BACL|nr:MAG: ABC transporter permease [Cohnella sp.]